MKPSSDLPKAFERVLRWVCKEAFIEEIIGDLYEYHNELKAFPKWKRKVFFWFHVFNFIRPWSVKSFLGIQHLNQYGMFKNYFKISWRSLLRQKTFSAINIGGLSVGLTCFILIFLYVQHELSYDRFYENEEQVFRVYQKQIGNTYLGSNNYALTPVGLTSALEEDFPEVLNSTVIKSFRGLISLNENHFYENGLYADAFFFDVLKHPLFEGDKKNALSRESSIVLSKSLSKRLFGDESALGKSVTFQNSAAYTVTGVIKDLPTTSSLQFSFIVSMASSRQYAWDIKEDVWGNNDYHTFFTLAKSANPRALEAKFPALLDKHPVTRRNPNVKRHYLIQPLSALHLENGFNMDIGLKGNAQYITLFSFIAIIVLLLACFNYMNLAIARSIRRAKEVGLRKVIGAVKRQLIMQFITESVLISFLGLLFAIGITYLALPIFSLWLDRSIELNLFQDRLLIPGLIALTVLVGAISGSYPAFFMSSLNPVQAFKGQVKGNKSGMNLQRCLVVAQYTASIVLLIGSLVISRQFHFIQNKELGYTTDQVLVINAEDRKLSEHYETLKNEWSRNPNVLAVTSTFELPTNVTSGTTVGMSSDWKAEGRLSIYRARVDYDYLSVFGIELIAGRDFSKTIKSDLEDGRIINESAAKALGWTPEEAIGQSIYERSERKVIGVIKDFHMHSMHAEIAPLMLMMKGEYFSYIAIKLKTNTLLSTVASLESDIKKYSPYPFDYQFLDDKFNELYREETQLGQIFRVFTFLAMIIASLGLFGIAAFTMKQRIKEIGIRKVLGASVATITVILTSDFIRLILIGFLIAVPTAWFVMAEWLNDYAYRIDIEWWVFGIAGMAALLIAFMTISAHAISAAMQNPSNLLRTE